MLTTQYQPSKQAGNGVILAFNFDFKILVAGDLVVSKIDQNGNPSGTLTLGVDYTVSFDPIAENGTVTYTSAPVSGGYSLIERQSDNTQESLLPVEGPLPAKTIETMVDKTTALIQELQATLAGTAANPLFQNGIKSARPSAPVYNAFYYATDQQELSMWIVAAGRWFTLG